MSKENKTSEKDIVAQLVEARAIIDECVAMLSKGKVQGGSKSSTKLKNKQSARLTKVDFGLNEKNFIKTYAKGLSGPKKFTLLLAYMTKGKIGIDVEVSKVSNKWKKMKAKNLLGYTFNGKYPNEAVTQGWVDSKKYGSYRLSQGWMGIFD